MTTPPQANDQAPTTTDAPKDIGELSFSDYQKVRRGEVTVESVQSKSAPADKAVQKKSEHSDSSESEAKLDGESELDPDGEGDEPESKESEGDKPKKKGGFQRRIDKLNQRASAAQQEAEYWKQQALKGANDASKNDLKPADAPKADELGKPDPEKFETHAAYVEALTEWKIEQKDKAKAEASAKSKLEADQKSAMKAHYDREKAFAEKTKDYREVMEDGDALKDASAALAELIVSSENGPELMYELAKNREEYERINKLGPLAAAREIGKIEAKFASAQASASDDKKPEPKKLTNAPKPIEPVGSGKGHVAKSIDDPNLSFSDYVRLRREQQKRKRG